MCAGGGELERLIELFYIVLIGVIFVNGWTDAPNAILSVVCSKSLSYKNAVLLAAVCNLFGVVIFSWVNISVADTISEMITFNFEPIECVVVLICALLSVIIYSVSAWWFGLPTSESHALIAGLTGAALGFGNLQSINLYSWNKVLYGLMLSLLFGYLSGWVFTLVLKKHLEHSTENFRKKVQIITAAMLAFAHSAQDGLKFAAMFILMQNIMTGNRFSITGAALITGVVMTAGTLIGGKRIIQNIGTNMTDTDSVTGVTSDIAAVVCLITATLYGLPVSTTHTKTMAVAGACVAKNKAGLNMYILGKLIFTWLMTFPVCGLLGYFLVRFVQLVHI
ncbi:MAG: inorganic phosphate transporter [Oscillospiraceae bacterium]